MQLLKREMRLESTTALAIDASEFEVARCGAENEFASTAFQAGVRSAIAQFASDARGAPNEESERGEGVKW